MVIRKLFKPINATLTSFEIGISFKIFPFLRNTFPPVNDEDLVEIDRFVRCPKKQKSNSISNVNKKIKQDFCGSRIVIT